MGEKHKRQPKRRFVFSLGSSTFSSTYNNAGFTWLQVHQQQSAHEASRTHVLCAGRSANKKLQDGGFEAKSWCILINHWPTAGFWQAATALSAAAVHSCAHLPVQLLLMHIHRIPHLYVRFFFECPSSPLPSLLLLLHHFPRILSSRPGLLQSWLRLKPSKGPLPLFCPLNWFCWGKKNQWRYIAHNLFMVPFDMCDI